MDGSPRLLVWNFTQDEKARLDHMLEMVQAPPAHAIAPERGHLVVRDILHTDTTGEEPFQCDEKIVLFYNIPQKGIYFLIQKFKDAGLPKPIFAVVTEHSINWPFSELAEHLIAERNAVQSRQSKQEDSA
ncbi:protein of unknown function [Desulfacinum hydrothermale DSM 13146]|uniref:DUF3783 domain-containing protein n=1 Tax=Desulfacinum hydrothermale DSM 13146 TaxID=1121390 RepID=A0A1W1XB67_9BACT|nr:DUF3783 domain-containing protein [Desulfacinum hydrothermale]SMC21014.1 protein of unknown function [Desulfacinum hydrothermale DSM 13146]